MARKYVTTMDSPTASFLANTVEEFMRMRSIVVKYKTFCGEIIEEKVGTATLINRLDKLYVLTCDHVYREAVADNKSVINGYEWSEVVPITRLKPVFRSEKLDIAILRFPFRSKFYVSWDNFTSTPSYPKDLGMYLVGYPAELVTSSKPNSHSVKRWGYWTSRTYKKVSDLKRHQFLLEYDKQLNNTDTNTGEALPNVPGMSGSLIVVPRDWKAGKLWTPGELDLVGMQTAWDERSVLYATRGNRIRDAWRLDEANEL